MPSPFPGMNPYLDGADTWPQLRLQLFALFLELINDQLGEKSICQVRPHPLPQNRSWLEISNLRRDERFTVIELIPGDAIAHRSGIHEYLTIRNRVVRSGSSYVGICLQRTANLAVNLRAIVSEHRGDGTPWIERDLPACDYCGLAIRAERPRELALWPITIRDRLPVIPLPLRPGDPDVTLDIQSALNRAYDAAGYEEYIYDAAPEPPLTPEQAEWAKAFIPPRAT